MKNFKKILALLLTAVLLLSVVPMSVFAEEVTVTSIDIPLLEVIEEYNGNWSGHTGENGQWVENSWFSYDISPKSITLNFSDNSSQTYNSIQELSEAGYNYDYKSEQSYENKWVAGQTYTASFSVQENVWYNYSVKVVENPVKSVTVEPMELIENYDGYTATDASIGTTVKYFSYNTAPEEITLTLKDNTVYTGDFNEVNEATNGALGYGDDQSYTNQWGVGEHTAYITAYGKKFAYNVKVVESPVKSVTAANLEVVEKADGYFDGHFDKDGNWVENSWFRYNVEPEQLTVVMKNGDKFTGEVWEIEEEIGYMIYCSTDQSYENQWKIGSHTATVNVAGKTASYTVKVVENPVKSISVEPITLTEKDPDCGEMTDEYDEDGNLIQAAWFSYDVVPKVITVKYKDGTTFKGSDSELEEETGESASYNTDQSYTNQWGAGEYKATASFMGVTCEYDVTIEETVIESITVDDISVIENSEGYYDEEYGCYVYEDFCPSYTVKLKDSTVLKSDEDGDVKINGEWKSLKILYNTIEQGEKPWVKGDEHTLIALFGGFKDTFKATIIENPIKSIEVSEVKIPEYTNGYYSWNDNGDEYYHYDYAGYLPFTVTLKDSTVLTSKEFTNGYYGVEINGSVYNIEVSDTQEEVAWDVGTHTATATLLGVTDEFNVTITETPIASIIIEDITVTQDLDSGVQMGVHCYDYSPEFTVVLKNGERITSKKGSVEIDGTEYYLATEDAQEEFTWQVGGTYVVTGRVGKAKTTFNVTVKKSPIKDVKLMSLPQKTTYKVGEAFDLRGATIRIYYTDGTYEDIFFDYSYTSSSPKSIYIEKLDRYMFIDMYSYKLYDVGTYYECFDFLNRELECPVKVTNDKVNSLSIRNGDNNELYVTVNGTEYKALEFEYGDGDQEDGVSKAYGWLVLQDGDKLLRYYAALCFDDYKFSIEINNVADDTSVKSNVLEQCLWSIMAYNSDVHFKYMFMGGLQDGVEFDGNVTAANVDHILDATVRWALNHGNEELVISEGDGYYLVDADLLASNVRSLFDISGIDLTLSEFYDADNGTYEWYHPNNFNGDYTFNGYTSIEYKDEIWTVKLRSYDGKTLEITMNDVGAITKWSICEHIYSGDTDTTCEECGDTRLVPNYEKGIRLVKEVDGRWWYYKNGMRAYETTLFKYNGKWFYVEDGIWDSTVTALVKYSGKWFYVKNGKWVVTTGLVKYQGKYFYVKGGKWDSTVTDLIKYNGKWFYVKNGKWANTADTLMKINGKWFLIKDGMWKATTGLVKYKGKYFYVKGGKWSSSVNTLYKKSGKWFAIKSGKWNTSKVIITYSGKKFYCNKGYAQLKYSGKVTVNKKTYTVKKGVVK